MQGSSNATTSATAAAAATVGAGFMVEMAATATEY